MNGPINAPKVADFLVGGSLGLFAVQSTNTEAQEWVKERTQLPGCYGPEYFPVEGRYIEDLVSGMLRDGYSVDVNGREAYIDDDDVVCVRP